MYVFLIWHIRPLAILSYVNICLQYLAKCNIVFMFNVTAHLTAGNFATLFGWFYLLGRALCSPQTLTH